MTPLNWKDGNLSVTPGSEDSSLVKLRKARQTLYETLKLTTYTNELRRPSTYVLSYRAIWQEI
jgi:hypothetical protein